MARRVWNASGAFIRGDGVGMLSGDQEPWTDGVPGQPCPALGLCVQDTCTLLLPPLVDLSCLGRATGCVGPGGKQL